MSFGKSGVKLPRLQFDDEGAFGRKFSGTGLTTDSASSSAAQAAVVAAASNTVLIILMPA